ncbi:MAG TPA: hypothetical protein VJM77_09010 [Nitrospiria bacterium]|nr:hypothetical protein [Nitrospiria bacterium]
MTKVFTPSASGEGSADPGKRIAGSLMKERRKSRNRRDRIDDRRQGERRQDEQRHGDRRKEYCPRCGVLLTPTGHCPVCKMRIIKVR